MAVRQGTVPALPPPPPLLRDSYLENPPLAEIDDADEFEDAAEEQPTNTMELRDAFKDCDVALNKFFSNDLVGAMNIMRPWGRTSLYHSLGTAIFDFIPAVLTFDHGQIARALASLKQCIAICNQHRRNYTLVESIGTIIKRPNYAQYTDMEAHAELCYAEALLLQALMYIMEGEDLTAFIKGTLKVKSCYNSYKYCAKILEKKVWESEDSKVHFASGQRLGIAAFNVMISLLPPKIISLLEFVGFSGDKEYGLRELEMGSRSPGLRSILCDLTLLVYHLVICHFISAPADLATCDVILTKQLQVYPKGVWFLVFMGRYELLQGLFYQAIDTYNRAISSQDTWPQFRHLCYWEIMWVNGMRLKWRDSAIYAGRLLEESSWSRTIYTYAKAAMLLQLEEDRTLSEIHQCVELMRNASYYKQRIAGKSLPMEKFMIKRCARYDAQGGRLVLPAVEMMCLWNMFGILVQNKRSAQALLKLIESTRDRVENDSRKWMAGYDGDNRALVRYLHGCLLAAMGLPRSAFQALESVFQLKSEVKEDTFLFPFALTEMATCMHRLGEKNRAIQLLQDARKKYTSYSLESRLHFRIHSKMEVIKNGLPEPPAWQPPIPEQ